MSCRVMSCGILCESWRVQRKTLAHRFTQMAKIDTDLMKSFCENLFLSVNICVQFLYKTE